MNILLVFATFVAVASAQNVLTSIKVQPATDRGYVEIEYTNVVTPLKGSVCGTIRLPTALLACQQHEYITTVGFGTAASLGIDTASIATPVAANLTCLGVFGLNVGFDNCTFEVASSGSCSRQDVMAVNCYFTIGQIVGIAIGAFVLCLLISILPFVLCCICCCCGICCAASAS